MKIWKERNTRVFPNIYRQVNPNVDEQVNPNWLVSMIGGELALWREKLGVEGEET